MLLNGPVAQMTCCRIIAGKLVVLLMDEGGIIVGLVLLCVLVRFQRHWGS